MNPLDLNYNKSTIFLLPIVLDEGSKFIDILSEDFENTYVADKNKPEHDDKFLVKYKSHDQYDIYDWDADEAVNLYVFLAGHYSNFTETAKTKILNFWEQDIHSELYKVLHTDREDEDAKGRNGELLEAPDLGKEIFGFVEIKDESE